MDPDSAKFKLKNIRFQATYSRKLNVFEIRFFTQWVKKNLSENQLIFRYDSVNIRNNIRLSFADSGGHKRKTFLQEDLKWQP